jgi:hypothetical protein
MIEKLPLFISIIFGLTTVATLFLFYKVLVNSNSEMRRKDATKVILGLTLWLVIQAVVTLQNFYSSNTNLLPPRIFLFGVLPPFITIIILFLTQKGRHFIDGLSLKYYTLLNIVRVPVEFVLWWLFLNKSVPELMTFEGRNFDIIAGISAPIIVYFGFAEGKLRNRFVVLAWNIICLGLLTNIGVNGFLSAPSPLQKLAFDQPNIALLFFPFSWLVSFIVPIVLLGHLISIRQLLKQVPANTDKK